MDWPLTHWVKENTQLFWDNSGDMGTVPVLCWGPAAEGASNELPIFLKEWEVCIQNFILAHDRQKCRVGKETELKLLRALITVLVRAKV